LILVSNKSGDNHRVVFNDANNNGVQDGGESACKSVGDCRWYWAITNANGVYHRDNEHRNLQCASLNFANGRYFSVPLSEVILVAASRQDRFIAEIISGLLPAGNQNLVIDLMAYTTVTPCFPAWL